jgi:RNA polymerase sigma-70 factor, ECF subfamily
MASSHAVRITGLLNNLRAGNHDAATELIHLIYPELRNIAARHMRRERAGHTLQPTALVHEAYMRVIGQEKIWQNRAHFFAVASQLMRQILVDHARKQQTAKRGAGARRVELKIDSVDALIVTEAEADTVIDIDRAITLLSAWDARQAEIVVFRIFGGLSEDEIAQVLSVSVRTVNRDWQMAKAWLHGVLSPPSNKHDG